MRNKILTGDCIERMKELPENSVDCIVTDPPYGIGFMGKEWDSFSPEYIKHRSGTAKRKDVALIEKAPIDHTSTSWQAGRYDRSLEGNHRFHNWFYEVAKAALRVLKPGGHLLSFGGSRTYHRMACAIEDAGFEIRDQIMWIYGSGFPKSLNIGKQIDKINGKKASEFKALGEYIKNKRIEKGISTIQLAEIGKFYGKVNHGGSVANWENGASVPTKEQWIILKRELKLDNKFDYIINREEAEREVIGQKEHGDPCNWYANMDTEERDKLQDITAPATEEAKTWDGWGTALKPAHEPIVVARKPLSEKNVALNVLKHGTAGINIDGCRIGDEIIKEHKSGKTALMGGLRGTEEAGGYISPEHKGRFPANVIFDEEAGKMLDEQSGQTGAFAPVKKAKRPNNVYGTYDYFGDDGKTFRGDKGGASRFFYCPKASKSERNKGLEGFEDKKRDESRKEGNVGGDNPRNRGVKLVKNNHPTVKPIKLMRYLIRLVCPKGGVVLDPFLGSGTTAIAAKLEGFDYIGIEKEEEYVKIAQARIDAHKVHKKLSQFSEK